ncbi:ATP-binding cassette domain-containing protein [Pedobacter sp. UYEF25]
MSILVEHLSKNFANQKAVDEVTFEGKEGRILGFLGPNGAGKSTTMRMLTGYLTPSGGCIKIAGFDMGSSQIEAKKNIGYLPENTPLYPEMYVKEFLTFIGQAYKLQHLSQRINEVINMVGLMPEQHKKIGSLSKGYRQRVGLAQAILHNPKVLILDEPTSGLDPNQLVEIRMLIKNLSVDKTVILSTHIMQEVEAICDDVVIITKGKIVANSPLCDLKKQFSPLGLEEIFKKLTLIEA